MPAVEMSKSVQCVNLEQRRHPRLILLTNLTGQVTYLKSVVLFPYTFFHSVVYDTCCILRHMTSCVRIIRAMVRWCWESHGYRCVVILAVEAVQLEMGSSCADPAGPTATRWMRPRKPH